VHIWESADANGFYHSNMISGEAGYRSLYLSHAKRALYHLSYIPRITTHLLYHNNNKPTTTTNPPQQQTNTTTTTKPHTHTQHTHAKQHQSNANRKSHLSTASNASPIASTAYTLTHRFASFRFVSLRFDSFRFVSRSNRRCPPDDRHAFSNSFTICGPRRTKAKTRRQALLLRCTFAPQCRHLQTHRRSPSTTTRRVGQPMASAAHPCRYAASGIVDTDAMKAKTMAKQAKPKSGELSR